MHENVDRCLPYAGCPLGKRVILIAAPSSPDGMHYVASLASLFDFRHFYSFPLIFVLLITRANPSIHSIMLKRLLENTSNNLLIIFILKILYHKLNKYANK